MKDNEYKDIDFKDNTSISQMNRREFIKITGGGIFIFGRITCDD